MSSAAALSPHEELLRNFAGISDRAQRQQMLDQYRSELSAELAVQLADAARERVRINTQEALALSEGAIAVAEILGDERSLAYGNRAKANALYATGHYRESIELHNRAIA